MSPESKDESPDSRPEQSLKEHAADLCEDIAEAAQIQQIINQLVEQKARFVSRVMRETHLKINPFVLRVEIHGEGAVVTDFDHKIKLTDASEFDATELSGVDEHGVTFANRRTRERLRIPSLNFDVSPHFGSDEDEEDEAASD